MTKHFSLFGQKMFYNLSHLIKSKLVLGLLVNLPISQPFFNQLKRFIFIGHQTYSLFPRTMQACGNFELVFCRLNAELTK
jgi:hypothetical protein